MPAVHGMKHGDRPALPFDRVRRLVRGTVRGVNFKAERDSSHCESVGVAEKAYVVVSTKSQLPEYESPGSLTEELL